MYDDRQSGKIYLEKDGLCGSYPFDSALFAMKYVDRMQEGPK